MSTKQEDDELRAARERLGGYLTHVPPSVCNGSYNKSVDFKKAITESKKVANSRTANLFTIQQAINRLHRYWEEAPCQTTN